MNSNQKKDATLGMSHGTAAGRLRKNILFHLLSKHNENVCFKCSEVIDKVEDLSIEHKKPWEGISAELFWDIENIAFSHLRCNRPHTNHGGTPKRILAPIGQSRCSGVCKEFKDLNEFSNHSTRWNGVDTECKSCKSKRNALRYI